jgi:hypothetical protein
MKDEERYRKKNAVRMLKRGFDVAVKGAGSSISINPESERLFHSIKRYVSRLEKLSEVDPKRRFWKVLRNASNKLLKYVRTKN